MDFKVFLENEEKKDVANALAKIPKHHSKLVHGYSVSLKGGNVLPGDKGHIGLIDDNKKQIIIMSPWHYGREFTFLHEVGHKVWAKLDKNIRAKWIALAKATKKKFKNKSPLDQNEEELFCMAYAQFYAKYKIKQYDHKEWAEFIKNLP